MTTIDTITDAQIELLRAYAVERRDPVLVDVCDMALGRRAEIVRLGRSARVGLAPGVAAWSTIVCSPREARYVCADAIAGVA